MKRFRWWHSLLRHRLRCDIDRHRMVTICDCGETWVTIGDGGSGYIETATENGVF